MMEKAGVRVKGVSRRRFFLRRLGTYLLVCMVPLFLVLLIVLGSLRSNSTQQLETEARTQLLQLQEEIEGIMEATRWQNELLSGIPNLSRNMQRLLRQDTLSYEDIQIMRMLQSIMSVSASANANILSVQFYYDGVERFYTTDFGITTAGHYGDMGWEAGLANAPENRSVWVEKRVVERYGYPTEILTIYQRVANTACTIVTNVFTDKLEKSLQDITGGKGQTLLVLDNDGTVLLADSEGARLAAEQGDGFLLGFGLGETESPVYFEKARIGGTNYFISYYNSYVYGVKYVSLVSYAQYYTQFYQSLRLFLASFVVLLLISAAGALYVTYLNFRQIGILTSAFAHEDAAARSATPGRLWSEYDDLFQNLVQNYVHASNLQRVEAQNKAEQKSLQLAMLQAQINPHFLMNTLQTIELEARGMGDKGREVAYVIDDLSYILGQTLQDIGETVTVGDELSYLRRYMRIQNFRFGDQYIVYYNYPDEVLGVPFYRLMLQPLLENSLYHGLKNKRERGYARVKIRIRGGRVFFTITDNGVGIPHAELAALRDTLAREDYAHSAHIGVANVNRRLVLNYGPDSGLHILSHAGLGTSIRFSIPAQ